MKGAEDLGCSTPDRGSMLLHIARPNLETPPGPLEVQGLSEQTGAPG